MLDLVRFVLNAAPSWTIGILWLAILRFALVTATYGPMTRLKMGMDRLGKALETETIEGDSSEEELAELHPKRVSLGCGIALGITAFTVFLRVYLPVALWMLLLSPDLPLPELAQPAWATALAVLAVQALKSWHTMDVPSGELVPDKVRVVRMVFFVLSVVVVGVIAFAAPLGVHLYWACVLSLEVVYGMIKGHRPVVA